MGANQSVVNDIEPKVCTEECEDIAYVITESVLSGRERIINPITQGGKRSMQSSQLEDPLRPLKAVATDLIVAEFFATAEPLIKFLRLVHNVYQKALSTFRKQTGIKKSQLFFIFKGGNILRIAANDFFSSLPALAKREIEDFYSPFFKRSDNDFGIYLNPKVPNYELRYKQLSTISYHLQDAIRNVIVNDPSSYFDYSRYSAEFKDRILKAWIPKFNEVADFEVNKIELVPSTGDSGMTFVRDDFGAPEREISSMKLKRHPSSLKVTNNNALDFSAGEYRSTFNLTRTKIHLMLSSTATGQTQRVAGELIDVSIGYKTDTSVQEIFEHLEGSLSSYTLASENPNLNINFESYSLDHIAADLEDILFRQRAFPWNDKKYAKRLNRLMYVYFIDIFIKRENNSGRLKVLSDFDKMLALPITSNSKLGPFEKTYSDLMCARLANYMKILIGKVNKDPEQRSFLVQMGEVIQQNLTFQMNALSKVKEYCSTDGKLMESEVYSGNLKMFV